MNLGGKPLLGRSTILTARSLMVLSASIIAVLWFEMDVTKFSILGIDPQSKLDESAIAVLIFLSVSHIVNWVGDAVSNGKFSLFSQNKPLEKLNDIQKQRSYICDLCQSMEGIEKQLQELQTDISPAESGRKIENIDESMKGLLGQMVALHKSGWWFSMYARFYVIGWNFVMPLAMATLAGYLLYNV